MVKLSGNMLSILSGFFFLVELGHSFVNLSEGFQEPKEVENFKCSFSSHCVGSTIESQRKQDCFSQHHTSANGHGFATRQVPPPTPACYFLHLSRPLCKLLGGLSLQR